MAMEKNLNNIRYQLTPQMQEYDRFVDRAHTRWLPFVMYFHQKNYQSDVVNTDGHGFRFSYQSDARYSAGTFQENVPVNLLVGSSTVFGVGASSDRHTLSSYLNELSDNKTIWLNFGGRGFNSTQELILFLLHRHQFSAINNITFFSGINNIVLAGFADESQTDYGPFFFSGEYYQQMSKLREEHKLKQMSLWQRLKYQWRGNNKVARPNLVGSNIDKRIAIATENLARDIDGWQVLAGKVNAKITFILQPLATWITKPLVSEEKLLFDALDAHPSNFWKSFQPILSAEVGNKYAMALKNICEAKGIAFHDMNAILNDCHETIKNEWLFVDRAHFNDIGYQRIAKLIYDNI